MQNTTTSIRLPLDLFIKVKEQELNLTQFVTNCLEDYFIQDEKDYEIKEVKEKLNFIDDEINRLKEDKIKLLAFKQRYEEEKDEIIRHHEFSVDTPEEREFWLTRAGKLGVFPEMREGAYRYYKNLIGEITKQDFNNKVEWIINEWWPEEKDRILQEQQKGVQK